MRPLLQNMEGYMPKKAAKTPPEPKEEPKTIVFETFRKIGTYQIGGLKDENPSCFNGNVAVRRYRVTIEEIQEPDDVIRARIQELWDECNNHHHWGPLRAAAKQYGLELKFN